MAETNCLYKCKDTSICGRSTCDSHCKVVTDEICHCCELFQLNPIVSKATKLQRIIEESIKLLNIGDVKEAKRILSAAMVM